MSINVLHIIVGLGKGGAETMLYNVIKFKANNNIKYTVLSLGMGDYYKDKIEELGVEVLIVNIKEDPVRSILKIFSYWKNYSVINCWMYHANLLGGICNLFFRKKLIWNIRHSNLEAKYNKLRTRIINKICIMLSKKVDVIAYNGKKAKDVHENLGYSKKVGCILENGCDINKYVKVNGLPYINGKKSIISISRDHPIKDIDNFINGIAMLKKDKQNIVGIMCGTGIESSNKKIIDKIESVDLIIDEDIFLLGRRDDIPELLGRADIYVLHSVAEAFPNTLIEAMASGCNVIATDVGDVKDIIIDNVIKVGDSKELFECMKKNLELDDNLILNRIEKNRRKVESQYDIRKKVLEYEKLYI